MSSLSDFNRFTDALPETGQLMPVLFIGHGSPMNGIEDNEFSRRWKKMATEVPTPAAVLVVSAHWFSKGTKITAMHHPKTIHDLAVSRKVFSPYNIRRPATRHSPSKQPNCCIRHM